MTERTQRLVLGFAEALAVKLAAAELKYGYSDNWARTHWMDDCRILLRRHLEKGDPRDVAAYCAFLWYHGESTTSEHAGEAKDDECWCHGDRADSDCPMHGVEAMRDALEHAGEGQVTDAMVDAANLAFEQWISGFDNIRITMGTAYGKNIGRNVLRTMLEAALTSVSTGETK